MTMIKRMISARISLMVGLALLLLLLGAMGNQGLAQNKATTANPATAGNEDDVELTADGGVTWLRDEKQYVANRNAVATRGTMQLRADQITANYRTINESDQLYRLDAFGRVVLIDGLTEAQGERGVYHIDKEIAILFGHDLQLSNQGRVITADDSLEYWQAKQIAVARGNALVVSDDKRLQANSLTAYFAPVKTKSKATTNKNQSGNLEVNRVDAIGNVKLVTASEIVTGKEGRYDVLDKKVTICGNVQITRGNDHLQGECATTDMETGISHINGGKKGKVKGLILPVKPAQ